MCKMSSEEEVIRRQDQQLLSDARVTCLDSRETIFSLWRQSRLPVCWPPPPEKQKRKKRFVYHVFGSNNNKKKKKTTSEKRYWAEDIVDIRLNVDCDLLFLIKWEGYPHSQNTWQLSEDLFECHALFSRFYQRSVREEEWPEESSWTYTVEDLREVNLVLRRVLHSDLGLLLKLNDREVQEFRVTAKNTRALQQHVHKYKEACARELRRQAKRADPWPLRLLLQYLVKELFISKHFRSLEEFFEFSRERAQLSDQLQQWKRETIPASLEGVVDVENLVDTCSPPPLKYLTEYHVAEGVHVTPTWTAWECDCADDCVRNRTCVCCVRFYKDNKRFRTSHVIYECSDTCNCAPDTCPNRRVQKGQRVRVVISRTVDRGWGLRAGEAIKYGQFVMDYCGQVLDSEGTRGRDSTYFFNIDQEFCGQTLFVDGRREGNVTRFANHSCQPNLDVHLALRCPEKDKIPRIAFFANRNIEAGEELTYDYKRHVLSLSATKGKYVKDDDSGYDSTDDRRQQNNVSVDAIDCKCGSQKCKQWI